MTQNLTQLFEAHKSNYSNFKMTKEQAENLEAWHEKRGRKGITLSQADNWMTRAGLIQKHVLSYTDTGMIFSKFKKFSLNEQQFMEYLETLAEDKQFDVDEVKAKLLSAGSPCEDINQVITPDEDLS